MICLVSMIEWASTTMPIGGRDLLQNAVPMISDQLRGTSINNPWVTGALLLRLSHVTHCHTFS